MPIRSITRRNFLKLIGIGAVSGIVSACASTQTIQPELDEVSQPSLTPSMQPSLTLAASPTTLPIPTNTPIPSSPTVTASPTLLATQASQDILTDRQKLNLEKSALKFVTQDEAEAIGVARSLGYIKNDGHPASVCGPLAIAILRDAGLLSKYVDLHAFWLLNPRDGLNLRTLERTFPREEFLWFSTKERVDRFDFISFPLKAGDFIYLYAGDPGSFEHMLAVSRVDQDGRAYAVTNLNTPAGYVIREVILYDPGSPGSGQFYEWTDRRNGAYGLTGFGGFDVWRFATPVPEPGLDEIALADEIDQVLGEFGGNWYVIFKEVAGKVHYARRIRDAIHPASVIKVPIAMLFMKYLEEQSPQDFKAALEKGVDGRSYAQLLKAMLVDSEEIATESLLKDLKNGRFDLPRMLHDWGIDSTDVQKRISSARDIGILFEGLYGDYLKPLSRKLLLDLMNVYTLGDDTRLGVLRKHIPDGYRFYNKRGTIIEEFLVVADCALIELPTSHGKQAFIIGAYGFGDQSKTTYEDLVKALEMMAGKFGEYAAKL